VSPEREKEIREILKCHGGLIAPITYELLAEINTLRKELKETKDHLHLYTDSSHKGVTNYSYRIHNSELAMHNRKFAHENEKLRARSENLREALRFYAGLENDGVWEDLKTFMTFDKFGGTDPDIAGPYVAKQALARDDEDSK
jgi:hypothetical protein